MEYHEALEAKSYLRQIEALIGIPFITKADDLASQRIRTIVELTESKLKFLLNEPDIPEALSYIVVEVVIRRFNRIGSEGASSHSVDGESLTFKDDDFSDFADDIQRYKEKQNPTPVQTSGVRFL